MVYRSEKAQAFHASLLAYLRSFQEGLDANSVHSSLNALDKASFLELSINDCSHILDVIHLPHEIIVDERIAGIVTGDLLQILLSKGRELFVDDKIPYIELLKQANKEGFTPLLSSLVKVLQIMCNYILIS